MHFKYKDDALIQSKKMWMLDTSCTIAYVEEEGRGYVGWDADVGWEKKFKMAKDTLVDETTYKCLLNDPYCVIFNKNT